MEGVPKFLTLSERIYRQLLYLYPANHRRHYGPEMVRLFRDLSRQTYHRGQAAGVFALWLRLLPDLGMSAGMERLSELKEDGMLSFCTRASVNPNVTFSLLASAAVLALGTIARAQIIQAGGSAWAGVSALIAANLVAAAILEIFARARGTAIVPTAILVASSLLPVLWVADVDQWLRSTQINAIVIIIAAYWHLLGPGRPSWPVYAVGIVMAAAQLAVSLPR